MEIQEKNAAAMEQEDGGGIRTRRVGSVTFGLTLIVFGVLFLVHMAAPFLDYDVIFRCWPIVFVFLGIEILVENRKSGEAGYKFVYDFPAILMLFLMLFFAMMMAVVDCAIQYERMWW